MSHEIPDHIGPLGAGVPVDPPGAVYVRSGDRGVWAPAEPSESITFGRESAQVDIGIGGDDGGVSRCHGAIRWYAGGGNGVWHLHNYGRRPIEVPGGRLLPDGDTTFPVPRTYTPVFVFGRRGRHLLEVAVAGARDQPVPPREGALTTDPPMRYPLTEEEEVPLLLLASRYLRFEPGCQPLDRAEITALLTDLRGEGWTRGRVDTAIEGVRPRLTTLGVPGLVADTDAGPGDHTLVVTLMTDGGLEVAKLDQLLERMDA